MGNVKSDRYDVYPPESYSVGDQWYQVIALKNSKKWEPWYTFYYHCGFFWGLNGCGSNAHSHGCYWWPFWHWWWVNWVRFCACWHTCSFTVNHYVDYWSTVYQVWQYELVEYEPGKWDLQFVPYDIVTIPGWTRKYNSNTRTYTYT